MRNNPTHPSIWTILGTEKLLVAAVTGVCGLVNSLPGFAVVDGESVNVHHCWNAVHSVVVLHVLSYICLRSQGVLSEGEWKTWSHTRPEPFTSKAVSAYQNETSNFHPLSAGSLSPPAPACFTSFLFDSFPPQNLFCHFGQLNPRSYAAAFLVFVFVPQTRSLGPVCSLPWELKS